MGIPIKEHNKLLPCCIFINEGSSTLLLVLGIHLYILLGSNDTGPPETFKSGIDNKLCVELIHTIPLNINDISPAQLVLFISLDNFRTLLY